MDRRLPARETASDPYASRADAGLDRAGETAPGAADAHERDPRLRPTPGQMPAGRGAGLRRPGHRGVSKTMEARVGKVSKQTEETLVKA